MLEIKILFLLGVAASFLFASVKADEVDVNALNLESQEAVVQESNENIKALPYYNALENVELNVGMSATPPFVLFSDDLAKPVGIEVDLIEELQRRLGFKLKNNRFSVTSFSELIENVTKGNMDIILGGISVTESRQKILDFAPDYIASRPVLVTRDSDALSIKKEQDLDGKTLVVVNGSSSKDILTDKSISVKSIEEPTTFLCIYAVAKGKADSFIIDEPIARYYEEAWPQGKFGISAVLSDETTPIAFAMKKGNECNATIIKAMEDMKKDGTINKIIAKYLDTTDGITVARK